MSAPPLADLLHRHQSRRAQNIPTTTALVGPVGLGGRGWRAWARGDRRPCVTGATVQPEEVLAAWLGAAFGAAEPVELAARWTAAAVGRHPDEFGTELARLTRYDLDTLWRGLPVDPRSPVARAAFLLLTARAGATPPEPGRFGRELMGSPGDPGRVVRAVTGLYPPDLWPALLLTPAPGELSAALRLLECVAVAEPQVPVGFAVSRAEYEPFAARFAGTRAAALAREGFVEVSGLTGNELGARLRAAGLEPPGDTVARLAHDGLAEDVATAFVAAVRSVREPTPADLASDFRSVHEEFLFGQLESLPQMAGLFRPNQTLAFKHGNQFAEADLLAAELKLVIEVDGAFYHLNPDQYRRDRRKDYLYQQHGYLVLRFLAEDVVSDLERILDTILEAVARCRGSAEPTGVE